MPLHVSSTMCSSSGVKIVLYSIWYHHTCRWPSGAPDGRFHFLRCLMLTSRASMAPNKAAFEVTSWNHHLVWVVTRLPKCSMIIPVILLYLRILYINVSFVIRYYIFHLIKIINSFHDSSLNLSFHRLFVLNTESQCLCFDRGHFQVIGLVNLFNS